jgi:hypothetical protein
MKKEKFISLVHNRIAELAVGSSALRNQGARQVVSKSRIFLKSLRLSKFATSREITFQKQLDFSTQALLRRLPRRARNWGTARKALNLFLRDVLYNSYLCEHYRFKKVEKNLEIPLDRYTMGGIRKDARDNSLLRPTTIIGLTPAVSKRYQCAAKKIAEQKGISRVQLDLIYWRSKDL